METYIRKQKWFEEALGLGDQALHNKAKNNEDSRLQCFSLDSREPDKERVFSNSFIWFKAK